MNKDRQVLGVIGGLGPIATAHFMELVIRMTDADCDQKNLDMIIYNSPSIPARTAYILDNSKASPLPDMIELGNKLAHQDADYIAIPCVTAHYFCDELSSNIPFPLLTVSEKPLLILKKTA